MHTYTCTRTNIHIHIHTHTHIHTYSPHTHLHTILHTHAQEHTHMHTHICLECDWNIACACMGFCMHGSLSFKFSAVQATPCPISLFTWNQMHMELSCHINFTHTLRRYLLVKAPKKENEQGREQRQGCSPIKNTQTWKSCVVTRLPEIPLKARQHQ